MKKSTKHQVEGKVLEMKGHLKEQVGAATNDHKLRADGLLDQAEGHIEQAVGKVEKTLGK